ncbi:MAG: putative Hexapeptide transferase [Promethearchaeota archaeon]|nr:MAG: putative Hexapeptide transferase [Candidatus Lokiarchaeota archaeon]
MNKKIAFSLVFLFINALCVMFFIINQFFFPIPIVDPICDEITYWAELIFYTYSIYVYGIVLIIYMFFFVCYAYGYSLTPRYQLTGSIMYVFSLLGFVVFTLTTSFYAFIGLFFNYELTLTTRVLLFLLFLPIVFAFSLLLFLVTLDYVIFLKDLLNARKIWKHHRPAYEIRKEGKMTYIDIETDEFVFTPVPMLIIAKYLHDKDFSVSWFVKGAFNHILSLIIRYLIGWPRARNALFRFMGMRIGKNCHISQNAVPDPLLPELIEFKNGSGCGIGVKLLTHNVMQVKHASFSFGPITVGENARIGAYSIIMPGVSIGKNTIIGSNSVVTKDIPPNSIAHGAPAKVIRTYDDSEREEVEKEY